MELFFREEDVLEILSFVAREAGINEIQVFSVCLFIMYPYCEKDADNIDNYFLVVKW